METPVGTCCALGSGQSGHSSSGDPWCEAGALAPFMCLVHALPSYVLILGCPVCVSCVLGVCSSGGAARTFHLLPYLPFSQACRLAAKFEAQHVCLGWRVALGAARTAVVLRVYLGCRLPCAGCEGGVLPLYTLPIGLHPPAAPPGRQVFYSASTCMTAFLPISPSDRTCPRTQDGDFSPCSRGCRAEGWSGFKG